MMSTMTIHGYRNMNKTGQATLLPSGQQTITSAIGFGNSEDDTPPAYSRQPTIEGSVRDFKATNTKSMHPMGTATSFYNSTQQQQKLQEQMQLEEL